MLGKRGLVRRCGSLSVYRGWADSVQWSLGVFFFLLLLERTLCLANPSTSSAPALGINHRPSVNVYMSEEEVKKLLGLDAELYYVRDDVVNHYALSFILPVSSETNSLHFTWRSKDKVDYRMGFHVDNPAAMNQPQSNISNQGEVPRTASVFRVDLFCSGKVDGEAVLTVQLNLTIHSNNFTVLNFKRRKICHKRIDPDLKMPPVSNNKTVPRPENGVSIPTTPPGCSIISVSGSSALVIFLVAIVLAVIVSDSGSSQGLSQPSTQTTQYLRADTPNNASAVTNHHPGTAPILQLAAATFPNPGAPVHETRNHHPGTAPILQLAAATFPNPGAPVHETRNVFQNGMFLTTSTVGDERSTKIGGTVDIQITAGTEPLSVI
nr:tyrosine-protein kinase RYK-like [Salvelinus alpinus]